MWTPGSLFEGTSSEREQLPPQAPTQRPPWAQSWSAEASQRASQVPDSSFQPLRSSQHGEKGPSPRQDMTDTAFTSDSKFKIPAHHRGASSTFSQVGRPPAGRDPVASTPPLEHGARAQASSPRTVAPLKAKAPMVPSAPAQPEAPLTEEAKPKIKTGKPRRPPTLDVSHSVASPRPTAAAVDGGIVKVGRREAWARFLAYEGCMHICLKASGKVSEAGVFLKDHSTVLRGAFDITGLLLTPAGPNTPETGCTIAWDDSEIVLPKLGFGPQTTRSSVVRCSVARLSAHDSRLPANPTAADPMYVCLRPKDWEVNQWHWTEVEAGGRGRGVEPLEIRADEMQEELLIEVRNSQGVVAAGALSASELWKVAGNQYNMDAGSTRAQKRGLLGLLTTFWGSHSSAHDDMFGKKWVQVFDPRGGGRGMGSVLLAAWISQQETVHMTAAPMATSLPEGAADKMSATSKGYQQVTAWQVYDLTMMAAIRAQQCGPRKLSIAGEWEWLLAMFANTYGIRNSYAALTQLRWVMRPENATPIADCLKLLCTALTPLEKQHSENALLQQEAAILKKVEEACEDLLARCFENYYALSEGAPGGITEGGMAAPESPAPALTPAVELAGLLRNVLQPVESVWMSDRFRIAACNRYRRLATACDDQLPFSREPGYRPQTAQQGVSGPLQQTAPTYEVSAQINLESDAEVAYARLGALSQAIKHELQTDLKIHDAAILPTFINLPQVTAAEYSAEYLLKLVNTLAQFPPPQPTQPAVDLLVTVGQQQEYFSWHNLLPPTGHPGSLDVLKVFGPYVQQWIDSSQDALCHRCKVLEANTFAAAVNPDMMQEEGRAMVAPLVEEMLHRLDAEIMRYERVIQYWPVFGPLLEGAVCAVLRDATGAVARQCGLTQAGHHRSASSAPRPGSPGRNGAWKWATAHGGAPYADLLPHEAVLLNSFRRLLAVVPQTEHKLSQWAGGSIPPLAPGTPRASASTHPISPSPTQGGREYAGPGVEVTFGGGMGPGMGAQFAQQVKELRSAYAGAVTSCAERIASAVFSSRSVLAVLQQHRLSPEPSVMSSQLEPALEALEAVMENLRRVLDARVYVALGRGLWDCTAREVFDYVEDLREGDQHRDAWRGRQNASAALGVVDNFFTSVISSALRHDVQSKDLDLPLHSAKAHNLLADNTAAVNLSYTVY